jgi:putative hemolysin
MKKEVLDDIITCRVLFFILLFILVLIFTNTVSAMPNPSAIYCGDLGKTFGGYNYDIVKTEYGKEGICVMPDGERLDAWKFFRGEIGKEFSYCAKKGYASKIGKEMTIDGVICLVPKITNNQMAFEETPVTGLMGIKEKMSHGDLKTTEKQKQEGTWFGFTSRAILSFFQKIIGFVIGKPTTELKGQSLASEYNASNFPSWDWKNPPNGTKWSRYNYAYFDNDNGWATPVKDQGQCGSCWDFSALGSVEAIYEIGQNESRLNPDLGEQYVLSCCGCGDCSVGGNMASALEYILEQGTSDEGCFPYEAQDLECIPCSDYASRLWYITDFTSFESYDNEEIEQVIVDYGPLDGAMSIGNIEWDGDIGRCDEITYPHPDHGIVIVGYNDTGNIDTSYWIIKNSWGTGYGYDGYFKLGFDECFLGVQIDFSDQVISPNFGPRIELNWPPQSYLSINQLIQFNFTVYTRIAVNATCDLVIKKVVTNETFISSTTANNNTLTTLEYPLETGDYRWYVRCWEKDLGIVNQSEIRDVGINLPLMVRLVSPEDGFYTKQLFQNFVCNTTSQSNQLKNITFFLWNSTSSIYNETKTISGLTNQSTFNYNFNHDSDYLWNCEACNVMSQCGFAAFNRTITIDTIVPTFSNNSTSSTYAGWQITHSLKWQDNSLSGFIFSFDNCENRFMNDTWQKFTGNWSNVSKRINSTVNCTIRWQIYANDSAGNSRSSDIYSYKTTFLMTQRHREN